VQNIFIACFFIALFQIFTKDELVYYNINFKISNCVTFYGTPSFVSTITTVAALTIREIGIIQGKSENCPKICMVTLIVTWMYIILISLLNFFSLINSLDQIIFGILLGIGIHIFVFYLQEIDTQKGKYLSFFIKINFLIHILYIIIPTIIFLIFYFSLLPNKKNQIEINKKLSTANCPTMDKLDMFFQQNNFSIILASIILLHPLIVLLLKIEFFYNFPKKENDWINYNFNNVTKSENNEESFFSDISIGDKDTRWNKTEIVQSFIRLFITYFICYGILLIFHFIEIKTENLFLFILGNMLLPYGIIFSFLFYFSKILFKKIFLSNEYIIILSG